MKSTSAAAISNSWTTTVAQQIGLRFADIPLAQGAAVRSAWIQFTCDETSDEPTMLTIQTEEVADAARFTDKTADISSRRWSPATVAWSPRPWRTPDQADVDQQTPDLAALLQSVIDRPDSRTGQALAFRITGSGRRVAASAHGSGTGSAVLHVEADEVAPAGSQAASPQLPYRVEFFFGAPRSLEAGTRLFRVKVQGEDVTAPIRLDSGQQSARTLTIERVLLGDVLEVEFVPERGRPLLSGIRLQQLDD